MGEFNRACSWSDLKMKCSICDSGNMKKLYTIQNYPITSGPVVVKGSSKVKHGNVSIGLCFDCGSCTLIEPNPDEIHYDSSYTSSNMAVSLGAGIDEKMSGFVELISELKMEKDSRMLEIGCYDGSLMWQMKKRFGFDVYGCEPCSDVADIAIKKYDFRVEKEYFSSDLYRKSFFDIVVFRNVLEHISNPIEFLDNVRDVLSSKGVILLSVPDGEFRITNSILGSIVPEHPNYFGSNLPMLLSASGFRYTKFIVYKGGLKVKAMKGPKRDLPKLKETKNIAVYKDLKAGAKGSIEKHKKIRSLTEGLSNIYFFGANTCTLELLATASVNAKDVCCVIDDDPLKWGKEIVNFGIPVEPRSVVKDIEGEKAFIVCSYYSHEKIFDFLNRELKPPFKILRLYPEIKLVEGMSK